MDKKRIGVLTATRAEYGLLKPVITALLKEESVETLVLVTGMHLSSEFGTTYNELLADNITAAVKIPILLSDDSPAGVSKSMGLALIGFADYFAQERLDMLLVLGDRFETLAVCCAAFNARIPIAHLYGGETTEGAVDEAYRHAITKMSLLHFTSTEEYRKRVIQLGEDPNRVFCVGALGVQNALNSKKLTLEDLQAELKFDLSTPYAVVTFHPVTLEENSAAAQCRELLSALDDHKELRYVITKANADTGGRQINALLEEYANEHSNVLLVSSLGERRYLSLLKHASMVIGNSSSGIVEAPSFGIPVINIGDRQKGRVQADNTINCFPERQDIIDAIVLGKTERVKNISKAVENPYYGDNTASKILHEIRKWMNKDKTSLKKNFYDIEVEV